MIRGLVCVDCSPLSVRSAGVKTWLYHWLNALETYDPTVGRFLSPALDALDHSAGIGANAFRLAALQLFNRMPSGLVDRFAPRCDVFHVSNLLRVVPRRPLVTATLHDLTAWVTPQFHRRVQVQADYAFAERVLSRASGIIAVSASTRDDAVRILRIDPRKIHVIYPGVHESYSSVGAADVRRAADFYRLREKYFLYMGTIEPRKNVDGVLTAWMSQPLSFRREHQLVLAGMPGWDCTQTMARIEDLSRDSDVRYLGYVPEALAPSLTTGALAMVYPSFYEGFGLPVAQAMAAGCPVITSRVSSLPEITGGAAVLVDPGSPAEIGGAMSAVAESDELRRRLSADGKARARIFNWKTAGEGSMALFRDLAGSVRRH